jgi:diketogulonate reductase-like aldo/keto reductase
VGLQTRSGKPVHPIGIGTWNVASHVGPPNTNSTYKDIGPVHNNEGQEIEAIRYSISKGQNHIDCAELYGGFYTDEVIGQAIAGAPREDLYIADKLWKPSVGRGMVRPTVEKMLKKLGTNYLDLLYIHWPFDDAPWREAIPQIDKLIDEGLVRHFGVSNFTLNNMQEALSLAEHQITANQMNYNVLYKREVNQAFQGFCKRHTIQIVAYQPVKRGEVLQNTTIQKIAQSHAASPAQVALAWLIARGALPIPKATNKAHIDDNLKSLEIKLEPSEIALLDRI